MITSFNLPDAYENVFGYRTVAFSSNPIITTDNKSRQRIECSATGSDYYDSAYQGTEYFMPVTLTYEEDVSGVIQLTGILSGSINTTSSTLKTWNLPYPVISISSRKTIVETALTERRGTVKELINVRDYDIVVRGFIISSTNDFPESDVTTLRTIYEQNMALSIQCPLTDIFLLRPDRSGSDQVVITDLKFPGLKGVKNVCPYELHMVSDEPFNLISIS